jgi:hypothetical protein
VTCDALLPDPENKEKVWKMLTDPDSTESLHKRIARMSGFYSVSQLDIIRPYFDRFYEDAIKVYQTQSFKYFENFVAHLLPRWEIQDKHIVKLVQMKNATPDTQSNLGKELQDSIEFLIRSREVREKASQL